MARVPGSGLAKTAAAVVFLVAVLTVAAFGLGGFGAPGGPSPSPTLAAEVPTPSPTDAPPPTPTPSPRPSPEEIAYTNPDGMRPGEYANDEYPFITEVQLLPTYGILWVDPNQRDFHIGLTGDIEGAIEALKNGIPSGITVYFYLVEHTQAEVCALRDHVMNDRAELLGLGIVVMGGGCGNKEMTASIFMSPAMPEVIAYMHERYPGPLALDEAGLSALERFEPPVFADVRLTAIDGNESNFVTCGRRPFPHDALSAAGDSEDGVGPEYDAFRETLDIYSELIPDLPELTWQLAEEDSYGATFLAARGNGWLEVPVFAAQDGWVPGVLNDCEPVPLEVTNGDVGWWLDPAFPAPTADTTELHVIVHEGACSGGTSPEARLLPPIVTYDSEALNLVMSVRSVGGLATCPGNPSLAVTVVLPEPLGDRDLNGASNPSF